MSRWPGPDEVLPPLRRWAEELGASRPDVAGVAIFGSYSTGRWGFGSDADVLVVLDECALPPPERARTIPDPTVPVSADVLVLARAELADMRARRMRFAMVVDTEALWLYRRPDREPADAGSAP